MNSKLNSPTSMKPSSPIPMTPNSPTTTPPRSTTPSDLFWKIQMIRKRRMIGPIFDNSILPNYWSTLLKRTLVSHIKDMITIKEVLIVLIRDVKYFLPMSVAPPAEQLALVTELVKMMEKFVNAKETTDHFLNYLLQTKRDIIEALTTSEQLVKSAKELLSTPAVLALSLHQMTMNNSQPSGSC